VFFALSAYLITEILLRERRKSGSISLKNFYIRRILRIWPLYFLFLLFTFLVVPHFLPGERFRWPARLAFLVFLGNWWTAVVKSVAAPLWSVSLEEQFYLTWPLLVRASGNWHRLACIGLLGVGVLYRSLLTHFHAARHLIEFSTFGKLDGIACGALLAFILNGRMPRLSRWRALALMAFGGLAVAVIWPVPVWASGLTNVIVAGGCAAILVSVMALQFRSATVEYLGKISYGLYVFHALAIGIA